MEKKPQADSPQKSPVSKSLPPASHEEDSKQPSNKTDTASTTASDQKLETVAPTAPPDHTPKPDSKFESKRDEKEESKPNATKTETTLPHPIISVDIQKSMPYENKQEVPQESEKDSNPGVAEVPPEVLASVVTKAVVNEAASAVVGTDGAASNGTKVTSDSSRVDSVVEQELNKLSEGKSQIKTNGDAKEDSKTLPNGDIDHSPVKDGYVSTSEVSGKEKAQSNSDSANIHSDHCTDTVENGVASETSDKPDVLAQNQKNSVDQTQVSEIGSINGVPGIITVVGISKKESAQNIKENSELTIDSKKSEDIKEKDEDVKEVLSENPIADSKVVNSLQSDIKELVAESNSNLDNLIKNEITGTISGGNFGDNLTDSAKIKSSAQKAHEEVENVQNTTTASVDHSSNLETETNDTSKKHQTSENVPDADGLKESIKIDNDNNTKEKTDDYAKISAENVGKPTEIKSSDTTLESTSMKNTDNKYKLENETLKEDDSVSATAVSRVTTHEEPLSKPEDNKAGEDASEKVSKKNDDTSTEVKATEGSTTAKGNAATEMLNADDEVCDMSMMASMTTSQILTKEMLDGGSAEKDEEKDIDSRKDKDSKDVSSTKEMMHEFKFCRISAKAGSPGTCDVGVGSEERTMVRVASGDGGEEEVDGQQATTEVELTEEPTTDTLSHTSLDGTTSPTSGRESTASKSSSIPTTSTASENHQDGDKPVSAVSRSSIPEPIVYEPPERRRSAASVSNEKKDEDADKSLRDEKESEKVKDGDEVSQASAKEDVQDTTESPEESKTGVAETSSSKENDKNKEKEEMDSNVKETERVEESAKDANPEGVVNNETVEEKEKGEEDEKDVETAESKSEGKVDDVSETDVKSGEQELKDDVNETSIQVLEEGLEDKDDGAAKDSNDSVAGDMVEEGQTENSEPQKDEDNPCEAEPEKADVEKEENEKVDVSKEMEEPKTLVEEEESKVDSSKEVEKAKAEDEKEGDDSEDAEDKKETAKEGEEEIGQEGEPEAMKDEENEQEAATEDKTGEEEEERPKDEESIPDAEEQKDKGNTDGEGTTEDNDVKAEKEEQVEQKTVEGEAEEEDEPPPKSPTKRGRSPEKAGRRGISPASSPPKSLKTPPSPQKPPKSTSPKKKNGMLSPIKTPKTPGSDTRKLPPIKAPVGLAPNPNLKNIRSKIGSFDNIKYKPGGGDKKVISTKKLEWKAAPKIGSLDHSFKGSEKKRSHSKGGESKESKATDAQSPSHSGDEAEPEVTSSDAPEALIKPEGSADMPVAIAAES